MYRHQLDLLSLLAGVFFLVVAVVALLDVTGLGISLAWVWPIGLVLLGVGVLVGGRRRSDDA